MSSNTDRRTATRYAVRQGLLAFKYMRKASWRLVVKAIFRKVARFTWSGFGELEIFGS
jgi:hypothetical protein